eukprot:Sspe_Gene.13179::Locus_4519_Transcript_1_1_Confidence_1.000_Length_3938::g.13179::m.13179
MDVLTGLEFSQLDVMKEKFLADPRGLEVKDFVECLDNFAQSRAVPDSQRIARLTGLFRTIDYNGDKRITWDEFVSYAIDAHMRNTHQKPHECIPLYEGHGVHNVHESVQRIVSLPTWGPEGRLVLMSRNTPFRVLDVKRMTTLASLPAHALSQGGLPSSVEWVPTLQYLATASTDSRIRLYDRDLVYRQSIATDSTPLKLVWNHRIERLFSATRLGHLVSYEIGKTTDPDDDDLPPPPPAQEDDDEMNIFSSGKTLAPSLSLTPMRVKKQRTRHCDQWHLHSKPMLDFLFLPHCPQRVVTCSLDGLIRTMDLEKSYPVRKDGGGGKEPRLMTGHHSLIGSHQNGVLAIAYCDEYQYLCSVGFEQQAFGWVVNVTNHRNEFIDHSNPHKGGYVGIFSVPRSAEIITADVRGVVKVWDVRTFRCVQTFPLAWTGRDNHIEVKIPSEMRQAAVCYVPSSKCLVGTVGRKLYVHRQKDDGIDKVNVSKVGWDETQPAKNPPPKYEAVHPDSISLVAYNATQRAFITSCGRDVKLWDVDQGCLFAHQRNVVGSDITALTLDDFDRRYYVGTQEGSVACRVFHTSQHIYCYTPTPSGDTSTEITSMIYWPNRRLLLASSLDGAVLLFHDKDYGQAVTRVEAHKGVELLAVVHNPALQLFASADARLITMADIQYPKRVLSKVAVQDLPGTLPSETITTLTFLTNLPALAIAFSTGSIRIISTRPMQRIANGGGIDTSPTLLAVWTNNAAKHREKWEVLWAINRKAHRPSSHTATSPEQENIRDAKKSTPTPLSPPQAIKEATSGTKNPNSTNVVTTMQYDSQSHILWTGDTDGVVTAWALCEVLQAHNLVPMSYPVKLQADGTPVVSTTLKCEWQPKVGIMRSWKAHREEVYALQLHVPSDLVITTGGDRRVLLWGSGGVLIAELLQGRNYIGGYGVWSGPTDQQLLDTMGYSRQLVTKDGKVERRPSAAARIVKAVGEHAMVNRPTAFDMLYTRLSAGSLPVATRCRSCQHPPLPRPLTAHEARNVHPEDFECYNPFAPAVPEASDLPPPLPKPAAPPVDSDDEEHVLEEKLQVLEDILDPPHDSASVSSLRDLQLDGTGADRSTTSAEKASHLTKGSDAFQRSLRTASGMCLRHPSAMQSVDSPPRTRRKDVVKVKDVAELALVKVGADQQRLAQRSAVPPPDTFLPKGPSGEAEATWWCEVMGKHPGEHVRCIMQCSPDAQIPQGLQGRQVKPPPKRTPNERLEWLIGAAATRRLGSAAVTVLASVLVASVCLLEQQPALREVVRSTPQ